MKSKKPSTAGFAFLAVFGGVFAAAGLGIGIVTLPRAWQQGLGESAAVATLVTIVFTAVGAGVIWLAFHGKRVVAAEAERQAQFPDQPWMWNEEWISGRIVGDGKLQVVIHWR